MADPKRNPGGKTSKPGEMTEAQRAYEQKRAAKAGQSLDAWMEQKRKKLAEAERAAAPPPAPKKPGLLKRLIDRAHKPL